MQNEQFFVALAKWLVLVLWFMAISCKDLALYLHSGKDRQVCEARDAHQRLVNQDGVHGLLNTVLGVQRG